MSLDTQRPTGTYDGPASPMVLREIIDRDMGELSSQDKEAIKHASGAFIRYTAFVLGSGLGLLGALRGRYHPTQWKNLPRLFPKGISRGHDAEVLRDRFGFGLRAIAFSMGGVLIGQSVGFAFGTWKSSQIIKREGNYEAIEKVMKKVQKDVMQEVGRQGVPGQGGITPQQRRKIQGSPFPPGTDQSGEFEDGENTRLARSFEQESGDKAWGETAFAKDLGNEPQKGNDLAFQSSTALPQPSNSDQTQAKRSRWEELRGQRGSQDSAWEKIRQDTARQEYNTSNSSRQAQLQGTSDDGAFLDDRPASEGFSEEARRAEDEARRRMTKDKERSEYEKMFEKESRGEDSIRR